MAIKKSAKETVKNTIENTVKVFNRVELKDAKEGIHTVFHKYGVTTFTNGIAEVEAKISEELEALGLLK